MVVAAALLVLAGLGMFVLGTTTGVAAWYWACLGACVAAGVLLVLTRRRTPPTPVADAPAPSAGAAAPRPPSPPARTAPPVTDDEPAADTGRHARAASPVPRPVPAGASPAGQAADPPEEDGEFTDLLLVVDLDDEVRVVDEHPRYHLAGCAWLAGRDSVPLPVSGARAGGFTPCSVCAPDASLAAVERARRAARRG